MKQLGNLRQGADLRVLSLGFTRSLWSPPGAATDDTLQRMRAYANAVDAYYVVTHALRREELTTPRQLAPNFWAYATNSRTLAGSWLGMAATSYRIARRQRVNVIQAQDPIVTGPLALMIARALGLPCNVCVYGPNPFDTHWLAESAKNRLLAPIGSTVLHRADGVQVDGQQTQRALIAAGVAAERIHIKPMVPHTIAGFFEVSATDSLRAHLLEGGRYTQLALFVGRLVPQKNLSLLFDVAQQLAESHPRLRFIGIGEGWQRAVLEREIRTRGLTGRVALIGALPHSAIAAYMGSCDVFVLPSHYEGFARVLMEAAAAARPIVTTAVSGADEAVIDGVSGAIVPIGDSARFAARLADVLSSSERADAMGRAGRKHMHAFAQRCADPQRQVRIWEQLLAMRRRDRVLAS